MPTNTTPADGLTLFGSFTSSSTYKPMLYLALARLPFSFRTVNLKNDVQKQPEHLAINRYGQVPVLRHRGLTLVKSNVILDYLARTTGKFEAATEQEQWMPASGCRGRTTTSPTSPRSAISAASARSSGGHVTSSARSPRRRSASSMRRWRGANGWWATRCTIADIGCWGRMVFMAEGGLDIARWPNVQAWSQRLAAMPGYALPYDLIPKKDREFAP